MFFCFLSSFFGGVSLCSGKSLCMLLVTRGKKERKCRMCIFPARLFLLFFSFFFFLAAVYSYAILLLFLLFVFHGAQFIHNFNSFFQASLSALLLFISTSVFFYPVISPSALVVFFHIFDFYVPHAVISFRFPYSFPSI